MFAYKDLFQYFFCNCTKGITLVSKVFFINTVASKTNMCVFGLCLCLSPCHILQLYDRGYKNVVALEPSQGMVNEAKKLNVYKQFITEALGKEPIPIKEGRRLLTVNASSNGKMFLLA